MTDDTPPRDAAERLQAIAGAHRYSRLLFTANHLGIFAFTQSPRTADEIAAARLCHERAAQPLLDALVGAGLLDVQNGRYVNTPEGACLALGHPSGFAHFVAHMAEACECWDRLDQCLRSGRPAVRGRHTPGSREQREYALAMEAVARRNAPDILAAVDFSPFRHLLDMGGGLGAHAIAFLDAYPRLRITLFEAPGTAERARQHIADAGLGDRCAVRAGDFLRDAPGTGYDAVWLSNVLHAYGPVANQTLLRRCFESLAPGGVLFARDFFLDEDGATPAFNALFGLHMLVHTDEGRTYRVDEIAELTRRAGFQPGRLLRNTAKAGIWVARKGGG